MSYDLDLKPRSGDFSQDRFLSYFQSRAPYVVQGQQAWYENEDTGVYFSFETHAAEAEGADADLAAAYPVSFNMNFCRPSFFALEAEPELSRVIREFDFVALDPQTDGQGDYDPARFLSEWRAGNEFGYSAMFGDPDRRPDVAALPRARLERIWRWNHARGQRQRELGDSIFVPRIMFFKDDPVVKPAVVWTDGIPRAFPSEVDAVVVYLNALAPKKFFRRKETVARASWESIRPLIERFGRSDDEAIVGTYSTPPPEVVSFLQSLTPTSQPLVGVNADSVLDAELVAKYRS